MQRFYFHQHLNGRLAKDQQGRRLGSGDEACAYAVYRIPTILRKTVRTTTNTHLNIEVSDGKRTVCVVRGSVIIDRR
jgi:hypothetical protein